MPLTATDFLRPTGRLSSSWLDGDDFAAILTALIAEAADKDPSNEEAQRAWVYYRAFSILADEAAARPGLEHVDDVRRAYARDQRDHWKLVAAEYLAEYQGITGGIVGGPVFQEVGYE